MAAHWTETEDYILATEWPKGGLERCRPMLPRRGMTALREWLRATGKLTFGRDANG